MSAPSYVFSVFLKKMSPLITAFLPTITESAVIFPSTCPLISIPVASNEPLTDPVSVTVISWTKTFPLISPATSILPEDLRSPSSCSVSPMCDLPL